MTAQDFLAFVAGGIAVLTFLGLIYRMLLKSLIHETREWFSWLKKFQRDWEGEPAEAGRDAVPGVMERLNRIDGELKRNGGESLKDKVVETWEKAQELDARVTTMELRQQEICEAVAGSNRG
jgi:hypothetical protein